MAGVEFTLATEQRAAELFQHLSDFYGRGFVQYTDKRLVRLTAVYPNEVVDWLIQYEYFDPTKDSYLIHE